MKTLFYLALVLTCLCSCEKELSLEGFIPPPVEPKPIDTAPVFQLKAFYSDIPIDFDETDGETKMETDLWEYVREYVKDDYHVFRNDSIVEVVQNAILKPGENSDTLRRSYSIGTDNLGQYMMYLTPEYEETRYRLYEWAPTYFVIGLKWKDGARVFSRFERIN